MCDTYHGMMARFKDTRYFAAALFSGGIHVLIQADGTSSRAVEYHTSTMRMMVMVDVSLSRRGLEPSGWRLESSDQ